MKTDAAALFSRRKLFRFLSAGAGALGLGGLWSASVRSAPASSPREQAQETVADPWQAFCEQLKLAGEQVLRPEAPGDDLTRAEGYRYLSRLLRAALEQEVEASDPQFPMFYQLSNETVKIGADNPDNHYLNAQIDGRYDYRVRGHRGSVSHVSFSTKAGSYGKTGDLQPTGSLDTSTLQVEEDGSFEVVLSASPKPGNWLPMRADSSMLIVRQTFLDRENEEPAEMAIECLNGERYPQPLTEQRVSGKLSAAAGFVQGTARIFADWAEVFQGSPNDFTVLDQARFQQQGGDSSIFYAHGYWELEQDEALLIEVPAVEREFWNFQVDNYWMESLDYRYFTIHLNKLNARSREDGSATLVLAHRDPGVENWLQTAGHTRGTMLYRTVHAREQVYPRARRVALSDVKRMLT